MGKVKTAGGVASGIAKNRSSPVRDVSATEGKGRVAAKKTLPVPKVVNLYGLTQATWDLFAGIADEMGSSPNKLMAKALNHLNSERAIREILDASTGDDLRKLTEAMDAMAWSEHAFGRYLWNWALSRLMKVLHSTNSPQLNSLGQIARYRAAFVLIEIGTRLELHALQDLEKARHASDDPQSFAEKYKHNFQELKAADLIKNLEIQSAKKFEGAKRALCFALAFQEDFLKVEKAEAVVVYNHSCIYSLIARVLVHESPNCPRKRLLQNVDSLTTNDAGAIGEHYRSAWDLEIGQSWRDVLKEKESLIEDLGSKAVFRLQQLTPAKLDSTGPPPSFWINLAKRDPDLIFLKFARNFRKDIENWENECARLGETEDPDLESLQLLPSMLSEELLRSAQTQFDILQGTSRR